MVMRRREIAIIAGIVLAVASIYCWQLWQPERQVRLHQENLIAAAEKRNRSRMEGFFASDYSDRWGLNKESALEASQQVLRQFFSLEIKAPIEQCEMGDRSAVITATVRLEGNGTAVADIAQRRVAGLTQPFTFHWERRSWQPWDWQLTRVNQPQLTLPGGFDW